MATRLIELVENLPKSRVVLVGDLMIDRYLYGNAERLSPEAPVPVLHFQKEELRLCGYRQLQDRQVEPHAAASQVRRGVDDLAQHFRNDQACDREIVAAQMQDRPADDACKDEGGQTEGEQGASRCTPSGERSCRLYADRQCCDAL